MARWKTTRRESKLLLRPGNPESCQNTIPGTSTPQINVTVAPWQSYICLLYTSPSPRDRSLS
eukprot:1510402-Pyramimonas_sp.AAC.1